MSLSRRTTWRAVWASKPEVGSSMSITCGQATSMAPSPTRLRSPPLTPERPMARSPIRVSAISRRWRSRSDEDTRACFLAAGRWLIFSAATKLRASRGVRVGARGSSCLLSDDDPNGSEGSGLPSSSTEPLQVVPWPGRPERAVSRHVLPDPEGPRSAMSLPPLMEPETGPRTVRSPIDTTTSLNVRVGGARHGASSAASCAMLLSSPMSTTWVDVNTPSTRSSSAPVPPLTLS
mmetsp:Transcript_7396/g.15069  ORF Transcript_7396/g.15069 Transcript_7396/m.15069 type:complete len:234 (-) Transcript_7396:125-826(-)